VSGSDARFMALALSLGRRGQGQCFPNPAVGCVIVREGRIVGRGWTAPGEIVMESLARIDTVAYVRFASVYKNFQAADDFDKFVSELRPEDAATNPKPDA